MYRLELQLKEGRKHPFPIDIFPVSIGSDKDADVHLPHKTVAGKHARIVKEGGQFMAVDLDSETGTFINGEPIERAPLRPGDQLRVGAAVFRFVAPMEGPEELVMPGASPEEAGDLEKPRERAKPSYSDQYKPARTGPSQSKRNQASTPRVSTHSGLNAGSPGISNAANVKPDSIRIKQQLLQYNKVDPDRERSFLKSDFAQFGGGQRILFIAVLLVVCAGIFWLCKWLAGI